MAARLSWPIQSRSWPKRVPKWRQRRVLRLRRRLGSRRRRESEVWHESRVRRNVAEIPERGLRLTSNGGVSSSTITPLSLNLAAESVSVNDALHQMSSASDRRTMWPGMYYDRPDKSANILAPIEQQCAWLRDIGFTDVDCYLKVFELAVFGGRRQ